MPLDVAGGSASGSDMAAAGGFNPNQTALSSNEQLFSPVTIRAYTDPAMDDPSGFEVPNTASFGNAADGAFDHNHIGPTRAELDPYFSVVVSGNPITFIEECDYQMMMSNGNGSKGGDANIRKLDRSTISAVNVTHFRGPMIMSGWGFDLGDRPVPSFGGDPFQFDASLVQNRALWKAGPIAFQWDMERKVWSMGHQLLHGVAIGGIRRAQNPCDPTYFNIRVFRNNEAGGRPAEGLPDSITNCDLEETVLVTNRDPSLSVEASEGMIYVVCARVNYEWVPLWVGCPEPEDAPDELPDCLC